MRGKTAKLLRAISAPPVPNVAPVLHRYQTHRGWKVRLLCGDRRRLLYKEAKSTWRAQSHDAKSTALIVWDLIHKTGGIRPAVPQWIVPQIMTRAVRRALQEKQNV